MFKILSTLSAIVSVKTSVLLFCVMIVMSTEITCI
jgi:hypothetical protein